MNIEELIDILENFKATYGNRAVYIRNINMEDYEVQGVSYMPEDEKNYDGFIIY